MVEATGVQKVNRWWVDIASGEETWRALVELEDKYYIRDCWPTTRIQATEEMRKKVIECVLKHMESNRLGRDS